MPESGMILIMIKFKIPTSLKWRVKLMQRGYDLGYEHGYANGMRDKEHDIIHLIESKIENLDWFEDNPLELRQVVPLIKKSYEPVAVDPWSN